MSEVAGEQVERGPEREIAERVGWMVDGVEQVRRCRTCRLILGHAGSPCVCSHLTGETVSGVVPASRLEQAERERDREREWRLEMTRKGERGELSGWKERAEQAEQRVRELERERDPYEERKMWRDRFYSATARAEAAESRLAEVEGALWKLAKELEAEAQSAYPGVLYPAYEDAAERVRAVLPTDKGDEA